MKARCPYCGRLVRIVATATPRPRLVKHEVPRAVTAALDLPAKTDCYGSGLTTHHVARVVQRVYYTTCLELAEA